MPHARLDEIERWFSPLAAALEVRFALRDARGEFLAGDAGLSVLASLSVLVGEETIAYLHLPPDTPHDLARALVGAVSAHAESGAAIRDLAHSLANAWKETNFSFELAQWLGGVFDVAEASDVIVRQLCHVQRAERVVLFLLDDDRLRLAAAHPPEAGANLLEGAQAALTVREPRLQRLGNRLGDRLQVFFPLWDGVHPVGVLFLEGTPRLGHTDNLKFLASVSTQITLAVRHRTMLEQEVAASEIRRDLELAREIQRSLLPREFPILEGATLAAECQPASFVGGDGYDFAHHAGGLDLLIADVAGHGVGAGLVMTHVLSMVRAFDRAALSIVEIVERANRFLCSEVGNSGIYMTGIYARLAPDSRHLTYVTLGHAPPLLCRGSQVEALAPSGGLPLGMSDSVPYQARSLDLQEDDLLLFYTDGFNEARSSGGVFFGFEGLRRVLERVGTHEPTYVLRQLFEACAAHAEGAIADDRTAIVLAMQRSTP